MHQHTDALALDIARRAQRLRIDVLEMVCRAQSGHLGGPYSAAEILGRSVLPPPAPRPGASRLAGAGPLPALEGPRCSHPLRRPGSPRLLPRRGARDLPALPDATGGPPGPQAARRRDGRWAAGARYRCGCRHGLGADARACPSPRPRCAPSAMAARGRVYVLLGDGELGRRGRLGGRHDRRQVPPRQPDRHRRLQRHPADRRDGRRHAHGAHRREVGARSAGTSRRSTATTSARSSMPSTGPTRSTPGPRSSSPARRRAAA